MVKPELVSCPLWNTFVLCVFLWGGGGYIQVFQTRRRDFLLASVRGLSPLWFTGICMLKKKKKKIFQSSVLFTLRLNSHLGIVFSWWKHCKDVFFFFLISTRLGMWKWENTACVWEDKINPPFILCKACIEFFFCIHYQKSFSAGLMYWLLCNSWTKHRLELIFKEKRLYSIFVL